MGLVMVGAADERALCEDLAPLWKGPVLNLCGTLSPRETAAALRHCKLLVCHDSGPMHLAATQQTRCIALFGNYNRPRKWYPFGSGHRVVYEPKGVREITVPRVAAEIDRALVGEDPTAHSQPHPAA
jgi:ADP-heptose:LPS heptosyltransferase